MVMEAIRQIYTGRFAPPGRISPGKIAAKVMEINEDMKISSKKVGRVLRGMGLETRSDGKKRYLILTDPKTRKKVNDLLRQFSYTPLDEVLGG